MSAEMVAEMRRWADDVAHQVVRQGLGVRLHAWADEMSTLEREAREGSVRVEALLDVLESIGDAVQKAMDT